MAEQINHPDHYGGDTPYETIKVLAAWDLLQSFAVGNAVKYLSRAGKKGAALDDLKKARWYLDFEIRRREAACTESLGEPTTTETPPSVPCAAVTPTSPGPIETWRPSRMAVLLSRLWCGRRR